MSSLFARLTAIAVVAALNLTPATGQPSASAQERLQVAVTFSILGDVVRNVAGDAVDLTVLVGPDSDAHTFEPSPEQIATIAEADLIFENGIGFEPWLDDMYSASGSGATRIVVTDGLTLLSHGGGGQDDAEIHTSDDGHDHGEHDPHVWHDVQNVIHEVGVVRDALATADPAHATTYAANADAYIQQLQTLDADILALVASLTVERRILITSHDALGYFAHRYGFALAASALGSLSTEAADPSAGEIAALIEEIRTSGVPAIFAENIENSDLMQQIASDAGVALAPTLFTDALSGSDGPASTYIAMMTVNATTIVSALAAGGA